MVVCALRLGVAELHVDSALLSMWESRGQWLARGGRPLEINSVKDGGRLAQMVICLTEVVSNENPELAAALLTSLTTCTPGGIPLVPSLSTDSLTLLFHSPKLWFSFLLGQISPPRRGFLTTTPHHPRFHNFSSPMPSAPKSHCF